jgi:hypothetical protein
LEMGAGGGSLSNYFCGLALYHSPPDLSFPGS